MSPFSMSYTLLFLSLASPPVMAQATPAPVTEQHEPKPAAAMPSPPDFPLGILKIGAQEAVIPDWRIVGFNEFPRFTSDGAWGDVAWETGDGIADVLTLGDFQIDLQLHLLTVQAIGAKLGIDDHDLGQLTLDKFPLLKRQTIASLVQAAPSLLNEPLEDLPLIEDLVLGVNPGLVTARLDLEELLTRYPEYGDIGLNYSGLHGYHLEDLPGLEIAPLQAFDGWQDAAISEVPLLKHLSWWALPEPITVDGAIAIAGVVTTAGESAVHAEDEHPELQIQLDSFDDDRLPLNWRVGATQSGGIGKGELANVNEGQELSGVLPFGGAFKVVPEQVSAHGFTTVIYFRSCRSLAEQVTCSPYGIGPIAFIDYKAGENIFLGAVEFEVVESEAKEAVAPIVTPSEVDENLIDTLLPTTATKVAAGGAVGLILTLMVGLVVWALRGDPVGFVQGTYQWALLKVAQSLQRKPGS